ncbi:MAG: 2-phospho-L-lactate transferase [Pseudomonadota bacterium]
MNRVVAISGGIGGAKLALGLYNILPPDALTVICNTGDDFEHLGLTVCPDIDTVTYTLAGLANRMLGWGREGETWAFMEALKAIGGETWFRLGDGDLALHVERTRRLAIGDSLSAITRDFARSLGIRAAVLPMADTHVRTIVQTPEGPLPFQRYFVEQQCAPAVTGFDFDGADKARLTPEVAAALSDPDVSCIVICPSNPFISIDPVLAVPGMVDALREVPAPIVAVSPLIGGDAVKGPTAKMMSELGLELSNRTIAARYGAFLDGLIVNPGDEVEVDLPQHATPTLMTTDAEKTAVATEVLAFAARLAG